MASLYSCARWLAVVFPLLQFAGAWYFRTNQNKGRWVGGEISVPKALWLAFTIGTWFILPILYLAMKPVPWFQLMLAIHLASWWTRGLLELFMIYKWFNWSPRYGITHDVVHVIIIFTLLVIAPVHQYVNELDSVIYAYFVLVIFSVICEMIFAALFLKVRGHGDHKTYFASDDPRWRFINRLTASADLICYGAIIYLSYLISFSA